MIARRESLVALALVAALPRAGRCDDPDSLPALTTGTTTHYEPSADALRAHTAELRREIPVEARDAALVLEARLREYLPRGCRFDSRRDAHGVVDALSFRLDCELSAVFELGAFEVSTRATPCGPGPVAGSAPECIGRVVGEALRATAGCLADFALIGFADRVPVIVRPGVSFAPGDPYRALIGAPPWSPLLTADDPEAQGRLSWARGGAFYSAMSNQLGPVPPGSVQVFIAGGGTAYQDNLPPSVCREGEARCDQARRIVVLIRLRPVARLDPTPCPADPTPLGALRCEEATHRAHAVRSTLGGVANGTAPLTRTRPGEAIPMCWSSTPDAHSCEWLDPAVIAEAATPSASNLPRR